MNSQQLVSNTADYVRGEIKYIHNGTDSAVTAFELCDEAQIRILLPRTLGVVSVYLELLSEDLGQRITLSEGYWSGIIREFDIYEIPLDIKGIGVGLYFFRFVIDSAEGRLYGYKNGSKIAFSKSESFFSHFQLSVSDFVHSAPKKKYGGIIYHIFVDRFYRGSREVPQKSGTVLVEDWSCGIPEYPAYPGAPLKNNRFYGGTLWGIIEKLDYIASLGADTIYLSPIFDAASNHKYDTGNYLEVDSMFGGTEALRELIDKARERGIGIILDGVFNHTGSDSIYFNREGHYDAQGAYNSVESPYFSWYDFRDHPDKYTSWWGIDILPRINPDKPECRAYFVGKGGVIDTYARMGIDGFRLDVADELSDDFIANIKNVLAKHNKQSILYGEVWEDGSNKIAYSKRKQYYLGKELDGVMNYPIRTGIIDYLTKKGISSLYYALTDIINNAPKRIRDAQMNLLGTHDTERIITTLGGESSEGRSNDYLVTKRMTEEERQRARLRLMMAYTILATVPGIPVIFYADETGLEGYHDPFNRMPYPWDRVDEELVEFYREIGRVRRANRVYKDGDFTLHILREDLLVYSRSDKKDSFITVVNNSHSAKELCFDKKARALLFDRCRKDNFTLAPYSAQIFKIPQGTSLTI